MHKKIPQPLPKADYTKINEDLEVMANEVDNLCKQYGKPYPLKIMGFILPEKENTQESSTIKP